MFRKLTFVSIVVGFFLIVLGGIVRVEGAGLGCGDDWPVCNGEVVPTFSYLTTIEYLHRVVAGIVLALTVALTVAGWRLRARNRHLFILPLVALVLVIAQALLGAITVFVELAPSAVTAHLGMAQTYFAALVVLALLIHNIQRGANRSTRALPAIGPLAAIAAGSVMLLMLTGAYVATSPAAWACPEWPGCHGYYVPAGTRPVDVHLLHRWAALIAFVAVFTLAIQAWRYRDRAGDIALLSMAAAGLITIQTVVGAMNIWFKLAPWVSVTHLAVATTLWGALVVILAREWTGYAATQYRDSRSFSAPASTSPAQPWP